MSTTMDKDQASRLPAPSHSKIIVRAFCHNDRFELLDLMRGLARFEGYLDDFAVTADDLITYGLSKAPRFHAFVAQRDGIGDLLGMIVLYELPWTYDMRPKLVMKELFVRPGFRGQGIGAALFDRAKRHATQVNASSLNWTVLKTNNRAMTFYRKLDGRPDPIWDLWTINY